jgi:hypothetical protein
MQAQITAYKEMQAEIELLKNKRKEDRMEVATLQKVVEEARMQAQESLRVHTQEVQSARAQVLQQFHVQAHEAEQLREQVALLRGQVGEIESLRAQVGEIESLRAQVGEVESLRAQVAQESAARLSAEEISDALTTQVGILRDTVMAYEVSYNLDMQQPPPQT